jgi:signal transduction histidine kinase
MPNAVLKHIPTGGSGVGVGIASMSERVEELGGRLEVASSEDGPTGTTVRVCLPLAREAA